MKDLTLSGGLAEGGNGGDGGAGGGGAAGMGGAIFNRGTLSVFQCTITGDTAQGGDGGFRANSINFGGGGGGGLGGNGDDGTSLDGGSGGPPNPGAPGHESAGGGSTNGGFGGGGGGGAQGGPFVAPSFGGFGGGGGGGGFSATGGAGGFGGGGGSGGMNSSVGGAGGFGGGNGGSNSGSGGGGAGMGGAIFNEAGTVQVSISTLTNNAAHGGSGGDSRALGGAIFNHNGTITVLNSTLSGNIAFAGGREIFSLGDSASKSVETDVFNSILGQSDTNVEDFTATTVGAGSISAIGTSNLIRTSSGALGFTNTIIGDPMLGVLANHLGLTQTMEPLPGSAAVNTGSTFLAGAYDQRGFARDPANAGTVDIGAFELYQGTVIVNTNADNNSVDGVLSFREAIGLANRTISLSGRSPQEKAQISGAPGDITTITFANANGLPGPITLSNVGDTSVGPSAFLVNSQLNIVGPSGNSGITLSAAGTTKRLFNVTNTGNLTLQNLTLSGGSAQGFAGGTGSNGGAGGGSAGLGGAIFNQGMLTILNSTITGNTALGGTGGNGGLVGGNGGGGGTG